MFAERVKKRGQVVGPALNGQLFLRKVIFKVEKSRSRESRGRETGWGYAVRVHRVVSRVE